VDPVPDPLLLRKSGSAGDRTRDLCICRQKLWPLDHRGGLNLDHRELYVKLVTILKTTLQFYTYCYNIKKKVKCSHYRPGVAQRVGRCIALLFHGPGTKRGWVVSSTPRPHFTPGKDTVPILQEAGWAPGPVWTGGKSRAQRDSIPDCPACSQSLYRLSYPAHTVTILRYHYQALQK